MFLLGEVNADVSVLEKHGAVSYTYLLFRFPTVFDREGDIVGSENANKIA